MGTIPSAHSFQGYGALSWEHDGPHPSSFLGCRGFGLWQPRRCPRPPGPGPEARGALFLLNRAAAVPLNTASAIQYNAEVRASAGPAFAGPDPGGGTFRRFGLGTVPGFADGVSPDHLVNSLAISVRSRTFGVTAGYRAWNGSARTIKVAAGREAVVEEAWDLAVTAEYIRPLHRLFHAKAGAALSRASYLAHAGTRLPGVEEAAADPDWRSVWRIKPVLTLAGSLCDNRLTLEAVLACTILDNRYFAAWEKDRAPFRWGLPLEPQARILYWL